jgi:hypothetical protein
MGELLDQYLKAQVATSMRDGSVITPLLVDLLPTWGDLEGECGCH